MRSMTRAISDQGKQQLLLSITSRKISLTSSNQASEVVEEGTHISPRISESDCQSVVIWTESESVDLNRAYITCLMITIIKNCFINST